MATRASVQDARAYFASDYFSARERFLALARSRGAHVATYPLNARGPAGETLAIDTAYLGARSPRRLLAVISGTHGVEGFAGSALQCQWLEGVSAARLPDDGGCLLIHALNPYGFAWLRRTNENNVDLNRNALPQFPGPPNPAYRRLDAWLNPPSVPRGSDLFLLQGLWLLARHGFASLQQAIVEGQYEYPRGLFYGGACTEESTAILWNILAADAWRDVKRLLLIDIHTGIGRFATHKLMVDVAEHSEAYRELARWFGPQSIASNRPADSIAYRVSGGLIERVMELYAPRQAYAGVLEFGTVAPIRMIAALRRENRAHHYGADNGAMVEAARAALREVFCPSRTEWRARLLTDGARVLAQAEHACFAAK